MFFPPRCMYKISRKGPVKLQSDFNLSQTSPASVLTCRFEIENATKISLNPLVTLLPFPDYYQLQVLRLHSGKGWYTLITGCAGQVKLRR